MKAAVTTKAGPPETIQIKELPNPVVKSGWVLIKVKATGINRSEMFTRQGHSPNVKFPIVQGIECVGVVVEDPSNTFAAGQQVAAIMGEMGRLFNGGYAEFTLVPQKIVFPFKSDLPWTTLGAIPEMFQTAYGSLHEALEIQKGESILIRGGTSSIGMLACQLAKNAGLYVISTTRNPAKAKSLLENDADHVIIDDQNIEQKVREVLPDGVNKVLELIGTQTLKDSLKSIAYKGTVCMTGILGNAWTMTSFSPMDDIPSSGKLTAYAGDAENLSAKMLQDFIILVEQGVIKINIDKVFDLDEIVDAHRSMESNSARGKLVIRI